MSEMIKRLATVLADELDRLQAEDQIEIRATADFSSTQIAARLLETMREPTADMCRGAAWDDIGPDECQLIWRFMIDEALK